MGLRGRQRIEAAGALIIVILVGAETSVGCAAGGSSPSPLSSVEINEGDGGSGGTTDDDVGEGGKIDFEGSGSGGGAPLCVPPDMLIVLDRSGTMQHTTGGEVPTDAPPHESSKWYQAIAAIEHVVAAPLDEGIRFGLELWPSDPGGDECTTMPDAVQGSIASNTYCQPGDVVVSPQISAGSAIDTVLDPMTTKLCWSTPTGGALVLAEQSLNGIAEEGREQYAMLVTDGADWNTTCPTPNPLAQVQAMAANGIKTFIVGFIDPTVDGTGAVGEGFLNDLACAGHTAANFPDGCVQQGNGYVADNNGSDLVYQQATNADELAAVFDQVASDICCDCVD